MPPPAVRRWLRPPAVRGLTVKHILLECHKFTQFRVPMEQYATSIQSSLSLALLLGDDHPTLTKLLFKFLDKAKLTTSI